jgi:amino acid permease
MFLILHLQITLWFRSTLPFFSRGFSELGPGSVRGSILALTTTALGAGMLSLPLVLATSGLALGSAIIIISGILAYTSISFLVACGAKTSIKDYNKLVKHVMGSPWHVVLLCVVLYSVISSTRSRSIT